MRGRTISARHLWTSSVKSHIEQQRRDVKAEVCEAGRAVVVQCFVHSAGRWYRTVRKQKGKSVLLIYNKAERKTADYVQKKQNMFHIYNTA